MVNMTKNLCSILLFIFSACVLLIHVYLQAFFLNTYIMLFIMSLNYYSTQTQFYVYTIIAEGSFVNVYQGHQLSGICLEFVIFYICH